MGATIKVAKRRNLKKEKAERNRANARQFRRKQSQMSSGRRGFQRGGGKKQDEDEKSDEMN